MYIQLRRFNLLNNQDAESAAYWALYKAITTYNNDKNVLLTTYATCCIYNALGDYMRTQHKKRQLEVLSYDAPMTDDLDFIDVLPGTDSAETVILNKELRSRLVQAVQDVLDGLTNEKHKKIFTMYIHSEFDISATEISKALNISQSYVSQTLAELKFKIRKRIGDYYER